MQQIAAFQKEPKQQPGQSVQAYGLECKKFYNRLAKIVPDPAKRWEMLMSAAVMRGARQSLQPAVQKFAEEAAQIASRKGLMPDFNLNTVLLYLQQAQDANRFSQLQGSMSSSRIGPRLKAFQAVDEDTEGSPDIDQTELIQQANLADVDENGLQEMVGLCNHDLDIDAFLTLAGVICYWCGMRGHVVKDCSTKCPDCGALPSKIPGQKSQHKPQCTMKTFAQNRINSRGSKGSSSKANSFKPD